MAIKWYCKATCDNPNCPHKLELYKMEASWDDMERSIKATGWVLKWNELDDMRWYTYCCPECAEEAYDNRTFQRKEVSDGD